MKLFIYLFTLAATAISQSYEELTEINDQFTNVFFQNVAKDNQGKSFVLSAFSVLPPLGLLAVASKGESHDEILKTIGLPNNEVVKEVFTNVTMELQNMKNLQLRLANRVYIRQDAVLNEQFAVVSREVFDSDVKNVNFTKNIEAAHEINAWVEEKTNNRIKNLISSDSLSATTAVVLVNAIYFKGKWQKPFDKRQTQDLDFYMSSDRTIKVPTMQKTDYFNYGENKELNAKILQMHYEEVPAYLLIVLPNEIDGINALIEKLKGISLKNAVENMVYTEVRVEIPKFKIETTTDLGSVLKHMGVEKLFTAGQARLDNLIKDQSNLYVSGAVQKAYIDVNEEGVEAAAANAFITAGGAFGGKKPQPIYFKADRPFYFELKLNDMALFNGIVIQPNQ